MPETFKRWMMRNRLTEQPIVGSWNARPVTKSDATLLGALMYDAYHDTIDDEGETPTEAMAEIEGTLNGKYGPLLDTCSLLVEEAGPRARRHHHHRLDRRATGTGNRCWPSS